MCTSKYVYIRVYIRSSPKTCTCITNHFPTCIESLPFSPCLLAFQEAPCRRHPVPKHHFPIWMSTLSAAQESLSRCSANIHTGMHCSGKPCCLSWPRTNSPLFLKRVLRMSMSRVTLLSERSKTQPSRATLSFSMMMPFSFRPSRHRERNASRSLSVKCPRGGVK